MFRTRETGLAKGCAVSYKGTFYMMIDADGAVLEAPDDTRLDVHVDGITEEMYVECSSWRWTCVAGAKCEGCGAVVVQGRRDLQGFLSRMGLGGAIREG